jgi:two-component system, NarL family, invasion response regulator UvrY
MEHEVALIDDHHLVRTGLATMINGLGGYKVVLEAGHGREFIDVLGQTNLSIAIIDLNMPVMDGYETIAWLRDNRPEIRSLALTFDATDDALVRAVHSGARGFVLKNARPAVLKTALDSLILTGFYYTEETHLAMQRSQDHRGHEKDRERVLSMITAREMEFLLHVCSENEPTYERIATMMGVHRRTVDTFRVSLFEKFNIRSKTGLVLFAMRWGILNNETAH